MSLYVFNKRQHITGQVAIASLYKFQSIREKKRKKPKGRLSFCRLPLREIILYYIIRAAIFPICYCGIKNDLC